MKILNTIIAVALVLASGSVLAGAITLSWTAPTQNEDGTALVDLAAYKFYYGTSSGNYTEAVRVDNPAMTTYVLEDLAPATYFVVATAINEVGVESQFSNEAAKTVSGNPPSPPINLTVADGIVYTLVKTIDRLVLLPVGTVPSGTVCDTSQSINGLYVVPRASVQWSGNIRPLVVVSECS